jgi:hypothetical protein
MNDEMILCVPGTWESRQSFLEAVVSTTRGEFMFAGMLLAHPGGNDHVELEFAGPDERMAEAFEYAGQGRLSDDTLNKLGEHRSVVYLYFPLDIFAQRSRLLKFTAVVSRCGGLAVKLENSGIAHEWERWFALLGSDDSFAAYCACVVLAGDERSYYSCGMHCFGLPDAQLSREFDVAEAADLLNQFNYHQIADQPNLASGHTFSLTADSPRFRLDLVADERHSDEELFHNPHGLWNLTRA